MPSVEDGPTPPLPGAHALIHDPVIGEDVHTAALTQAAEKLGRLLGVTATEDDSEPTIVGLGGYLGSGKDAFADFLVEDHGFVKLQMSEALHEATLVLNPWFKLSHPLVKRTGDGTYEAGEFHTYQEIIAHSSYVTAKTHAEIRTWLQKLGTEFGRKMISEDVWVDVMRGLIEKRTAAGQSKIAITGIRYENELEMIRSLGGDTLWVERPDATEHYNRTAFHHSSEGTLSRAQFAGWIDNSGDLDALRRMADAYARDGGTPMKTVHVSGICKHCGEAIQWNPVLHYGMHTSGSYRGKSRCGQESQVEYGYNAEPVGQPCTDPCLGTVRRDPKLSE